jgi:hypothetical protein
MIILTIEYSDPPNPIIPTIKLGGVGHCFAWHVRVGLDFNFNFNFKTEELVHSGLCAM